MFKANEQNVFKIEHTFEWIDLIDLKIRTATNYNRIAKKKSRGSFILYHR